MLPTSDVDLEEDSRAHYAKSRIGGKALRYLLLHTRATEARGELVTVANIVEFLEAIFTNLH